MDFKKQYEGDDVVILEGAQVRGDVTIGRGSSVWFNAVIRGDEGAIQIGEDTNIQDCAVLHAGMNGSVLIGSGVTVGHGAILHGCTIGDNALIGMGAIVLDGAKIGRNCIVGAGALVPGKMDLPDGWMAYGNPAKAIRPATEKEIDFNRHDADVYKQQRERYR